MWSSTFASYARIAMRIDALLGQHVYLDTNALIYTCPFRVTFYGGAD